MAYSSNPVALWKGAPVTLQNSAGRVNFSVITQDDGAVVYTGRAVSRPGAASVVTDIADIAADYCRQTPIPIPSFFLDQTYDRGTAFPGIFNRRFVVQVSGTTVTSINVDCIADWSYRYATPSRSGFLSDPVLNLVSPDQVLVFSHHYAPATSVALKQGGTTLESVTGLTASRPYNYAFPLARHSVGGTDIQVTSGSAAAAFKVLACPADVLYYVNAFGGWDSLVVAPMVKVSQEITRQAVTMDPDLAAYDERNRRDFLIETGQLFQVSTPWLTDTESDKFSLHVPGSPLLFLQHDGAVYPVTVEDTQLQAFLTQYTNGRRPVRYTINLRLAAYRFRK